MRFETFNRTYHIFLINVTKKKYMIVVLNIKYLHEKRMNIFIMASTTEVYFLQLMIRYYFLLKIITQNEIMSIKDK